MANYISIPILDELVHFAEQDSKYEDAVKAMSSSILVHYFPPLKGFSVVSEQNRNNHYADYIVLRIQRRFPGDRGIVDHTVVEAKKKDRSIGRIAWTARKCTWELEQRVWTLLGSADSRRRVHVLQISSTSTRQQSSSSLGTSTGTKYLSCTAWFRNNWLDVATYDTTRHPAHSRLMRTGKWQFCNARSKIARGICI